MIVRPEEPRDHDAVAAVHRTAFGEEGSTVAAVVEGLRPGRPESLVAEVDGAVVGHVMVGRNLLDAPALFLEGDPAWYAGRGFRAAGDLGFRRPSLRIPPAAFQVVLLDGWEDWMTGTLVDDRVFWDLDAVGLR